MNTDGFSDKLRTLILETASRPDVHSVSCFFDDFSLWEGLSLEQIKRARETGKPPIEAFFLSGPDSGIPGIAPMVVDDEYDPDPQIEFLAEKMGWQIHIPYEGFCSADLLVYPSWRKIYPERWKEDNAELDWATPMRKCNLLIIQQDLGEAECVNRDYISNGWWIYSSRAPYKNCAV